jgi:hypothetical protein
MFDIVIPIGPNDVSIGEKQIEFTKKNVIGYRNIYIICSINIEGCITIPETSFPFSINTVAEYHKKNNRNGWYLQQLLKLYAGFVIPDILDTYLVIDVDTFFLKPTLFLNKKCMYNYADEYYHPYFIHMKKLHPSFEKVHSNSGICHHMMFQTKYVKEMMNMIEELHNELFYKVFLKQVTDILGSGASEYEMYFNFMIKNHTDEIIIRKLSFINTGHFNTNVYYDYISYHHYLR